MPKGRERIGLIPASSSLKTSAVQPSSMNLDAYLRRIAYDGPLAVDAATLEALQRAHLLAVPFENLSIGWSEPITIDLARHYAKIVERRRGGFCYEQNHLFAWVLAQIGFTVGALSAGVWAMREGIEDFGDASSHLLTRVDLDQLWIADVGFGENFRAPLRLVDALVQEQPPHAYRVDRSIEAGEETWTMSSRGIDDTWKPGYRFANVVRPMAHFERMCRFHQTSPQSPFTQKRVCSLATRDGRITLSGNEWIVTGLDGSRIMTPIVDEDEARTLLKRHFGIDMPIDIANAQASSPRS